MGAFVKGDVIIVPFPFSLTAGEKRRPALVLASWPCKSTTDYLLCLISSQNIPEPSIVKLANDDIIGGSLSQQSYIRPAYLFTVTESRIVRKVGTLKQDCLNEIIAEVKSLLD